jgi:hypothetical protein
VVVLIFEINAMVLSSYRDIFVIFSIDTILLTGLLVRQLRTRTAAVISLRSLDSPDRRGES